MCIASAISLLMILICGMATYGAYKVSDDPLDPIFTFYIYFFGTNICRQLLDCLFLSYKALARPNCLTQIPLFQLRPTWIIPFFCYQIFDFALNTLVAVSIVVYPNTIQDYLQQLVRGR